MNVVILENENRNSASIEAMLEASQVNVRVVKKLQSVREAIHYFAQHHQPDLIFSDTELADGRSFDLFRNGGVEVPVVFCANTEQHALEAFRSNGIDYLLKPFNRPDLLRAIDKVKRFRQHTPLDNPLITMQHSSFTAVHPIQHSALLINYQDRIIPFRLASIALFYIVHRSTILVTFDQKKYEVSHSLDELEIMGGQQFYRANRQYLVNRDAIHDAMQHHSRKLFLNLLVEGQHNITIPKNKVPEFLTWLRN